MLALKSHDHTLLMSYVVVWSRANQSYAAICSNHKMALSRINQPWRICINRSDKPTGKCQWSHKQTKHITPCAFGMGYSVLNLFTKHYSDVIMSAMASQITVVLVGYSSVCSGADQRKYQNSVSLAFVKGIHGWPDDVIMISNMVPYKNTHCMTFSWLIPSIWLLQQLL